MNLSAINFERQTLRNFAVWLFYFFVTILVALPHGINTIIDVRGWTTSAATGISQLSTLDQAIEIYGDGDAGIYSKMGRDIAIGKYSDYEYWRLRLFAPGNTFLNAFCRFCFGPSFPIVLYMSLLTACCWASVMFNINLLNERFHSTWAKLFYPIGLFATGLTTTYFLRKGVMLSESISTAGFALSLMYAMRALQKKKMQFAITSGICLAMAAYMRAQNELVALSLSILVVVALIPKIPTLILSCQEILKQKNAIAVLSVCVFVFNALTIPYRFWNLHQYQSLTWLQWDHYWEANWRDPKAFYKEGSQRLIEQGETVAALVNPGLAATIQKEVNAKGPFAFPDSYYKNNSIMTFIRHPRTWLILKYPAMYGAWIELNLETQMTDRTGSLHIEHLIYAGLLVFCAIRFVILSALWKRLKGEEFLYFAFFSALLGANMLTSIFIHLEPRYYYTLKMFSLILVMLFFVRPVNKVVKDNA